MHKGNSLLQAENDDRDLTITTLRKQARTFHHLLEIGIRIQLGEVENAKKMRCKCKRKGHGHSFRRYKRDKNLTWQRNCVAHDANEEAVSSLSEVEWLSTSSTTAKYTKSPDQEPSLFLDMFRYSPEEFVRLPSSLRGAINCEATIKCQERNDGKGEEEASRLVDEMEKRREDLSGDDETFNNDGKVKQIGDLLWSLKCETIGTQRQNS